MWVGVIACVGGCDSVCGCDSACMFTTSGGKFTTSVHLP